MLRARAGHEYGKPAYAAVPRALSVLLLCSSVFSSVLLPASAENSSVTRPPHRTLAQAMLSIRQTILRISPPASGVRLLEQVFQRVRSTPQVAMAKNLMQQQQTAQALSQNKGRTDYNLAIRPKQAGKTALPASPTLAMLPPTANEAGDGAYANRNKPMSVANAEPVGLGGTLLAAAPPPPPSAVPESWLGAKQYPSAAFKDGNGYTTGMVRPAPASPNRGLWENSIALRPNANTTLERASSESGYGDEGSFGYSPAGNALGGGSITTRGVKIYQPPDLATAANRLMNTAKALEEAQSAGSVRMQAGASQPQKKAEATAYKTLAKESTHAAQAAPAAGAPAELDAAAPMQASNMPAKTQGKHISISAQDQEMSLQDRKASAAERKAKKAPYAAYDKARARRERIADDLDSLENEKRDATKLAWRPGDIALLPPNVVTGIPLVRLGISETQASNALTTMGSMKQDKVNKWTVWSWQRAQNKTQTALQLYMRNGLLDAMRIFDASLIAPDFGVRMGDDLGRVKEKFGEPAFILQEPEPGAGQNYIYPISQVGFQLARPAPDQQPRVVSVLIFNVK